MYSRCRAARNRLGVERLDHSLGLAAVLNKQGAAGKDAVHGVDNLVETAGCALLLREPDDAEVISPAVFNHSHNLHSEVNFSDIEDWQRQLSVGGAFRCESLNKEQR